MEKIYQETVPCLTIYNTELCKAHRRKFKLFGIPDEDCEELECKQDCPMYKG